MTQSAFKKLNGSLKRGIPFKEACSPENGGMARIMRSQVALVSRTERLMAFTKARFANECVAR
jgi:hypothetical protein